MKRDSLITSAVLGLIGLGILVQQHFIEIANALSSNLAPNHTLSSPASTTVDTTHTDSPNVLKLNLSVVSPKDLKIRQGDTVTAGQVLADRNDERQQLIAQQQELALLLKKIQETTITKPNAPLPVPTVKDLPPTFYKEEEAAIDAANLAVEQAQREFDAQQERLKNSPLEESSAVRRAEVAVNEKQRAVDIQKRKIDMVQSLKDLPPEVLTHEQEVLKQREAELQQVQADWHQTQAKEQAASHDQAEKLQKLAHAVERATAERQLAISKLQTAKDKRAYTEYEASVTAARRVEEHNQADENYTRQLQEAENHERDRNYQVAEVQSKLNEVDSKLANLSVIRSPYSGVIRHIKFNGANDKNLSVEVTLAVTNGTNVPTISTEQGKHSK